MPVITATELRSILGVGATVSDATLDQKIAAAEGAILPFLKTTNGGLEIDYAEVPAVKEAILNASVDIYKMNTAPGGNYSGVDFNPSPWQLGRSFFERYEGLVSSWIDVRNLIG